MEEDFPALPSGTTGSSGPNNSLMTGGAGAPGMMEQFQRMKLDMGGQQGQDAGNSSEGRPDRFGMLGLMSVIRMMDENLTTLALGTDLTHLGLNLNAADNLYETFQSPWADARSNRTPDYSLPRCYYISPPALKTAFFHKFSDMTLFYIFYHFLTRPSDASHQELRASLVKYAYQELSSRGWQYQNDANVWVTRVQSTNELKFFDMQSMELRPFSGQPAQGSLSQGSDGM
jgi:CCR4-NOT transcription complex subunit 2